MALNYVGIVELVSFPDDSIQSVPAKVDTGADSSAIWASAISELDGQLSFRLFDKTSPFYTGKLHSSDDYSVISVKNSFGKSELRYKVKLRLRVGGKTIRAKCTLANRAHNKYPVLIGRKTLHGKFVVDPAREPAKKELDILILSTKQTVATKAFTENVQKSSKRLRVTYAAYEDLCYVSGVPGTKITLRDGGRDIASFNLVHFKTTSRLMDVAASTARYLEKRNVPFVDEAIKHFPATSKLYQYVMLQDNYIAVPKSVFMLPGVLAGSFDLISQELGLPFILKDIHGNKGEHNYLVKNKAGFDGAMRQASLDSVMCIAQAFVPNDEDYRVLVFGHKISLVIRRRRINDSTHLNNTSQGARADIVPTTSLPPSVQKMSIAAAKLMERQIAGVDIVQDKTTGLWYCLEVNDGPQLATGSFRAEKHAALADYLERKLK